MPLDVSSAAFFFCVYSYTSFERDGTPKWLSHLKEKILDYFPHEEREAIERS